jgi:arginyl-tRNA synthetase
VLGAVELTHAGFGTMNGTDGKPFKTREGGVMRLEDLIDITIEKARSRMAEAHVAEDFDATERDDVAHKVAIAAIKFADLQNARQADYVFDLDRLSRFEGKTGPYLLYQAVRIKSLLRRAEKSIDFNASLILDEPDRPLALLLAEFPETVEAALKNYAPHYLCEYAFRLAQTFSSFYGNCHILSETNVDIRNSRLALCAMTRRQMDIVLSLLGIDIPERM